MFYMKKIHILLIGPIRPNMNYILDLLKRLKNDIPNIITHISFWKTNESDKNILIDNFDFVYENEEPLLEDCIKKINSFYKQIFYEKVGLNCIINVYKTFVNMHYFFNKSYNNIGEQDILFRFRTDNFYQIIDKNLFVNLINYINQFPKNYYMVRRSDSWNGCCDWAGISTYENIKKVWDFPDIVNGANDFNNLIRTVYNPESLILKKIKINKINIVEINNIMRLALCRNYSENNIKYCYGNLLKIN